MIKRFSYLTIFLNLLFILNFAAATEGSVDPKYNYHKDWTKNTYHFHIQPDALRDNPNLKSLENRDFANEADARAAWEAVNAAKKSGSGLSGLFRRFFGGSATPAPTTPVPATPPPATPPPQVSATPAPATPVAKPVATTPVRAATPAPATPAAQAAPSATPVPAAPVEAKALENPPMTIVSWNAQNFGDKKIKTIEEESVKRGVNIMANLAQAFAKADFIALQEIDTKDYQNGLEKLRKAIQDNWGAGETACWGFSEPESKNPHDAERFAFIWRDSRVHYVTTAGKDESCKLKDGRASFINLPSIKELATKLARPPGYGTFIFLPAMQKFHYVTVHFRPTKKTPALEVQPLFASMDRATPDELRNDDLSSGHYPVIVSGDFNLGDTDPAFQNARTLGFQSVFKDQATSMHEKVKGLNAAYDNFWLRPGRETTLKVETKNVQLLWSFFPDSWEQNFIFYHISDHCPVQTQIKFVTTP